MDIKRIARAIKNHLQPPEPCKNEWELDKLVTRNMDAYQRIVGYRFDINNPRTFTEKIQWYKVYYQDPRLKQIVDKYEFKKYIAEKLGDGWTIGLIAVYNNIEDFISNWDQLPDSFCLKSTISSGGDNIIPVKNKADVNKKDIIRTVRTWFDPRNTLLNSYCRGYFDCKPRVIAEEYAENIAGQLFDYKAYCFNGEPFTICASVNHFGDEHYPITYYDLNWKKLNVKSGVHKNDDIPAPPHLNQMIEISRKLSADFPFVRVDFFDTDEHLYMAEMTFYPGGGLFKYDPESFNVTMGDLFVLPE